MEARYGTVLFYESRRSQNFHLKLAIWSKSIVIMRKAVQRIRGWLKGIVVQVDAKMVAVQFRSNVFLTDGWMVPDHILWYPVNSPHIRFRAPEEHAEYEPEFIRIGNGLIYRPMNERNSPPGI